MNKFILIDNEVVRIEGENLIISETFYINNKDIKVLITEENEYYNIFVIHEDFKADYLNCLQLQEPKECVNKEIFNKLYCELKAIEFQLWHKYNKSFNIEVFEDK